MKRVASIAAGIGSVCASEPPAVLADIPAELHERLLTVLMRAIRERGIAKNVQLATGVWLACARSMIGCFDAETLTRMAQADQAALRAATAITDSLLDIIAGMRVLNVMWRMEGFIEFDLAQFFVPAARWARDRAAHDVPAICWWPSIPDMLDDYNAMRNPLQPVVIRYPKDRPGRASWQLDARASGRETSSPLKADKALVPLLARCPGLPGRFFPDGKKFETTAGGAVHTSWWKGGKLHRDHREGPAWIDASYLGTIEEFRAHGELHRPSAEGPARRHLNPDGTVLCESYYNHGRKHRDPAEGPAQIWYDLKTGRVTEREYYVDGKNIRTLKYHPDGSLSIDVWNRDGKLHRDPAEGPAAMWSCAIEIRTQYFVDGRCHRDPAEGPASIVRSPTGELIEVAYWVHGEMLRKHRSKRQQRALQRRSAAHSRRVRQAQAPKADTKGQSAAVPVAAPTPEAKTHMTGARVAPANHNSSVPRAPDGEENELFVLYPYGVELHPRLPPLPLDIFNVAWHRVAEVMRVTARRKSFWLREQDLDMWVYLTVVYLHHRGLCVPLYGCDKAAIEVLEQLLDEILERRFGAGSALTQLLIDSCGSPNRKETPVLESKPLPTGLYDAVRPKLLAAMQDIAARKNVPFTVARCEDGVDDMMQFLRGPELAGKFLVGHPDVVRQMEAYIDAGFDHAIIRQFFYESATAQGLSDDQIDWQLLVLWIHEAMIRLSARHPAGSFYRWPDLGEGTAAALAEFGIPAVDLRQRVKT
ncbi:MAG TPA: hypothetical protein VHE81_09355 [Lacipirellulaceae bacterium]|nr:hypothetical protein [Lacipirellulaceae bacterium]